MTRIHTLALAASILVAALTQTTAWAGKKAARLQTVPLRQVQEVIAQYVKERTTGPVAEVQVAVLDPLEPIAVPPGSVSLRVVSESADGYGRREFDVAVAVNGRPQQTVRTTADVTALVDAVVLTHPIRLDEVIQAEDLMLARTPAALGGRHIITDPTDVVGKRAVRPLPANTPIPVTALAAPYAVRKGERVTIEAKRGGLVIRAVGTTKAVGQVGQVVTVTNQDSGKDVQATVVGPGLVRVEF